MSIIIPGVEMPKNCAECDTFRIGKYCTRMNGYADNVETYVAEKTRHPLCPLIELPTHGDLIDRDELESDISRNVSFVGGDTDSELMGAAKIINRIYRAKAVIESDRNG